jgi:hypothetical protein
MQLLILPMILAAGMLATATTAQADSSRDKDKDARGVLSIAVFGDSPYGTSNADTAQFMATPAFIKTINADPDVSLVLHVGDIHSGQQICTKEYDQSIYNLWTGAPVAGVPAAPGFKFPVVYTPGDNEWTDCHKKNESGGANGGNPNPLENLKFVRDIFFANPGHTIAVDMPVWSQSKNFDPRYPTDADFVENVIWEKSGVVFVTMNIPGGSNNDEDNWGNPTPLNQTKAQTDEILNRTGADLRWLDQAFALARDDHAQAVVIQLQADMWDLDGKPPSHIGAYRQFIDSIALHTTGFGRPVLLLNGDSHKYRSDNPLVEGAPCVTEKPGDQAAEAACADDAYDNQPNGYNVRNFHRIVVHGSTPQMEWLKLNVKPGESEGRASASSFGPFSWKRMIQALPPAP